MPVSGSTQLLVPSQIIAQSGLPSSTSSKGFLSHTTTTSTILRNKKQLDTQSDVILATNEDVSSTRNDQQYLHVQPTVTAMGGKLKISDLPIF